MLSSLLDDLARSRGIGDAYYDYRGELRSFSAKTKTAILVAMGCNVTDSEAIRREIAELEAERWRTVLPAVAVVRPGRPAVVLAVPADALDRPLSWSVRLADGARRDGTARANDLTEVERRELDGRWLTRRLLVLPEGLPRGYHTLQVISPDGTRGECTLIVAPGRCFEAAALSVGEKLWGVALQLYTLRSQDNWGVGDFADLEFVVRHCALHGGSFVGLNPLHALFPANPAHFSPYSASTRHFLNVLYIAVPRVPEFAECIEARRLAQEASFVEELNRLRALDTVDYPGVTRAKLAVLRLIYDHFCHEHLGRDTARARAFLAYAAQRGELLQLHALHDTIDAHLRATNQEKFWGWPAWPEELRHPAQPGVQAFAAASAQSVRFHAWLQWIADEQLAGVQGLALELGMPIGLYGDFAVGVNPCGSETWSDQAVYRRGAGVGAPPDPLALMGQDWGTPPQDPHALIAGRYRPFSNLIAANMRHFGALRLDHVMALFRQWWVPVGLGSTDGGYVHYPLDDLMSVLALESDRHRCLVIGEDLGTVPDEVRGAMAERAVYHYKVLLFEKESDGSFRRPEHYVRRAIAAVTTHDLPTLRGFWEGRDLALRDRLNLFPGEEIRRHTYAERVRDRAQLLAALDDTGLRPARAGDADGPFSEDLARALQLYLARSAAALAVLQIEDLIGMGDPVNVPGTGAEYANWQRKLTATLAEVFEDEATAQLLEDVQFARSS